MALDVFEVLAKLVLDSKDFDKGLDDADGKVNSFASKLKSGLGAVGKGIGAATVASAKVIGAATVAAGGATVVMTKQATSAYAEYQQLAGGIETLYKDSAAKMMQYADAAYTTAGQSVNDYMNTAIQGSAAMISALGGDTDLAAEKMNQSIIDMSDNVNKMGTTMEAVQNAYRGFSRGNFTINSLMSVA